MHDEPSIPETPQSDGTAEERPGATVSVTVEESRVSAIATTGKRQAFRDIRRELQEQELSSPGVQKLLLEELENADARCEILEAYVERFHEADKRAAVLEEKLRTQTAFDILFVVVVGLGCAIVGLTPLFWDTTSKGPITLVVGLLLVAGATGARIVKR
jgi:hypothetical protein